MIDVNWSKAPKDAETWEAFGGLYCMFCKPGFVWPKQFKEYQEK